MRYQDNPLIRARYNSKRWIGARKYKIQSVNGLCERCLKERIYKEGKIVHHKIHITEENYLDDELMYGLDNLEFLCDEHHKMVHGQLKQCLFNENGDYVKNE